MAVPDKPKRDQTTGDDVSNADECPATGPARETAREIRALFDAVGRLSFGTVAVTIHNSKIVQIDVTERTRFPNN